MPANQKAPSPSTDTSPVLWNQQEKDGNAIWKTGKGQELVIFRRGSPKSQLAYKEMLKLLSVQRSANRKNNYLSPLTGKLRKLAHTGCGHMEPPCTAWRTMVLPAGDPSIPLSDTSPMGQQFPAWVYIPEKSPHRARRQHIFRYLFSLVCGGIELEAGWMSTPGGWLAQRECSAARRYRLDLHVAAGMDSKTQQWVR